jgi:hypothetical protein
VDSESKSVSFGWVLLSLSTALYLLNALGFSADRWERMVMIAAILVGGKVVKETILGKVGKSDAPPQPPK